MIYNSNNKYKISRSTYIKKRTRSIMEKKLHKFPDSPKETEIYHTQGWEDSVS